MRNTKAKRIDSGKRILSVTIKRMIDDSPDTSHLGEYSDRATSEFSIDREHSEDCASLEHNHADALSKLERILNYVESLYNAELEAANLIPELEDNKLFSQDSSDEVEALEDACSAISDAQKDVQECDCGERGDRGRGEYRYFNPSFNYVDNNGWPKGLTAEEVRKYTRQDYERMERLNAGDWCYIGFRAEAQIALPSGKMSDSSVVQDITSGGLWGIESDSDKAYFAEVVGEELSELKAQLTALGFSKRAISQAFKPENIKEVDA